MAENQRSRALQKERSIKNIRKASVRARRLNSSYTRSKSKTENVGETTQETPADYAEERLRGSANVAITASENASRKAVSRGREFAKQNGAEKAASKAAEPVAKKARKNASRAAKAAVEKSRALMSALAAGGSALAMIIVIICLIGLLAGSCFGIFFSGEDTGNGMSMQTAIREINEEYNHRIEEIRATTPSDRFELSNANPDWPEVLAVYAVKNSSDDEVVSVTDEKVELLKEVFWDMNEISSSTRTKSTSVAIETADEDGNIVVEQSTERLNFLYVTVEHKTADEMADEYDFTDEQKEQLAELLSDENSGLWSSVMYGIGKSDDEIVKVALTQLGNVGGQPYWSWYGFDSRVAWCACFVSWCANECGYIDTGVIPKFAGCVVGVQWFKEHDQWQSRTYTPKAGDIIFFDWEHDGETDHVGIVESVSDGYVHTIEGNTSNSCRKRQYSLNSSVIFGYGVPAY